MTSRSRHLVLAALALLPATAAAQDMPTPAPELQKLQPLIGHWTGTGTAIFDPTAGPSKWESQSTYQWALGNHFVQEDTVIHFEGMPQPMVFRGYLGWDRENARWVSLAITNGGEAKLNEMVWLPDGTVLQIMRQEREGTPYAERTRMKVDGDSMTFRIDMLMPEGPSMELVAGSFRRADKGRATALDASAFMAEPAAPMVQMAKMAGDYEVEGEFAMAPGAPSTRFSGTDAVRAIFDGTVVHVHTIGTAEGMPGEYLADSFMAWNAARNRFDAVFVSNMGEVGSMEVRFAADGKSTITTGAAVYMGQPMVQRFVLELDDAGKCKRGVGHAIMGTAAPFQSFAATYTAK